MIIVKQVTPQYGVVGEKLTFTLTVTNDDTFPIQSVTIYDVLVSEFLYVENSLKINGQSTTGSPEIGVSLGDMNAGAINEISFEVEVLEKGLGTATNQATGSYVFFNETTGQQEFVQVSSEEITVPLLDIIVEAVKSQDKDSATIGEIVNYTINVYNNGDLDLINVIITDQLSPAFELQEGTIRVNGVTNPNYNLAEGIVIPMLPQGEAVIVTFSVMVKGCSCSRCINNTAYISAQYILPNGTLGSQMYKTNTTGLLVGLSCFKQLVINKELRIPMCHPEIEGINDLAASIRIDDTYAINTREGISVEGQVLTGRKIVVNGVINVILNYTGLITTQMVFAKEYEIPFGAYLVMPMECGENDSFEVAGTIEKLHYAITSPREVSISISMLLQALVG